LLAQREERLLFVYLPDCDRAGHAHGWMSPRYLAAAAEVDAGVGALVSGSNDTVFIITADHGGGGVTRTEHDAPHPVNDHIPLIIAGPGVTRRHQLTRPLSLLDVPATILWWFGLPVPQRYEGRPVVEAFTRVHGPVTVPALCVGSPTWVARRRRSAPAVRCSCGIVGSARLPCWRTPGLTS